MAGEGILGQVMPGFLQDPEQVQNPPLSLNGQPNYVMRLQEGSAPAAAPAPSAASDSPSGALGKVSDERQTAPQPTVHDPGTMTETAADQAHKSNITSLHDTLAELRKERQDLFNDDRRIHVLEQMGQMTPAQADEARRYHQTERDRIDATEYRTKLDNPLGSTTNHPGVLGKIGHVLGRVGEVAGESMGFPTVLIPGSQANLKAREAGALGRVAGDEKTNIEAQAAVAKTDKEDTWTHSGPPQVADDGTIYQPEVNKKGEFRLVPQGGTPGVQAPAAQAPAAGGALGAVQPPAGALGKVPAPAKGQPVAAGSAPAPTAGTPKFTKLGQTPKEDDEPATANQMSDVNAALAGVPHLSEEQRSSMSFPEGVVPTKGDVKSRLGIIKELAAANRQSDQDAQNNAIRRMEAANSNLLAKAHLEDLQDKHKKAEDTAVEAANTATAGLYAQQDYNDKVKSWQNSSGYVKDLGLVTEIVNKEHGGKGGFSGAMGGALVGSLLGPEGTAVGAAVGTIGNMLSDTANGYLDSLKKAGISDAGYAAMQAYFNSLPARMAYEMSVQKLGASAMRSSQLIQKVINTVPSPNTPKSAWDDAYNGYYKPMETLTQGKIKLEAPKGYTPPAKESFYPAKAAAPTQEKDALPAGAQYRHDVFGVNTMFGLPKGTTPVYQDNDVIGYATPDQEKQGKYTQRSTGGKK
jgi:hypothetical protein